MRASSTFISTLVLACAVALAASPRLAAQGPPPEVRALLDAFRAALNSGSAEAWEAFAQERFARGLIGSLSPGERRAMYERLHADFGAIAFGRINRRGPGAPLEISISGATGATGTLMVALDDGPPPRIASLSIEVGNRERDDPGGGVPAPPVNATMADDQISRALDGYFSKLAAADVFSGVALVARAGAPIFHRAYGFADRASRIANAAHTRFNIGSINKAFTQVAIAQLARDGKLAYTDTIGKFFPDYPQAESRAATIQQLLEHKGGIADVFGPEFERTAKDRFRSNADYFRFVSALPPLFAPGARSQYCNGCYIALGAIVERVAGIAYERYVAEHIFAPAGMKDTGYPQTDSIEPDVAMGYTRRSAGGSLRSNVYMHGAAGSAAGGGYSTALDLLSYVKAVAAGRFPGAERGMGIAGGAPGINAVVESNGEWAVIVLTNLDPPTGQRIGVAIGRALSR